MQLGMGEWLKKFLAKTLAKDDTTRMNYPPPISKTIGFELIDLGDGYATLQMETDPAVHGNPMGTVHGGVLCDIADAAIGTAHGATLLEDESFTSIDLRINFFRPLWKEKIKATARAIQHGKTISYYQCDITKGDGKLVAIVTSTVMTLRGNQAKGR